MIIYSVTVNINKSVEDDWLRWMKEKHIPDVMNTGCFVSYRITRLLSPESYDPDSTTYNIQYTLESLGKLREYQHLYAPPLQKEHEERYAGKFHAFRTILKEV